jgi:arginine/lysine/ornithine decarboxylase
MRGGSSRDARRLVVGVWQPGEINGHPFVEADPELRASACLGAEARAEWHGFSDLGDDYCMLDIKVTVLTPGLSREGQLENFGIPAPLVTSFLSSRGIVAEKTEPYSFLMLFSVGVTKGKWGSMVAGLLEFKRYYDGNEQLSQVLPGLVNSHPERYQGMGLKDLADAMHTEMANTRLLHSMDAAFTILPDAVFNPRKTYGQLVKGNIEQIRVEDMVDRVVAVQVVPYPPGIPLMMPGEKVTQEKRAVVDYLLALQAFDSHFPEPEQR